MSEYFFLKKKHKEYIKKNNQIISILIYNDQLINHQ